jgi:hypothetical protein
MVVRSFLTARASVAVAAMVLSTAVGAADTTSGSLEYKGRTAALKHAWLVTGPSDMEPGKTVRRVILSATDIGGRIAGCKTFSCTDGEVTEGMTIDFTGGPRLNYWVALNGQKLQYSGTARPEAFTARANDAARLAGRLGIDDTASGGPKVGAEFDLAVTKEFKVGR